MILDVAVFQWLNGLAGEVEPFDQLVRLMAGDHLLPMLSACSLIWLWLAGVGHRERVRFQSAALDGLFALGLASLIASLLAIAIGRARPFLDVHDVEMLFYAPTDHSFPAHSVVVLVALGTAIHAGHRSLGNVVLAAGVVMGVARVIVGVQWPSDVLGAVVIGLIVGASAHWLLDRLGPVRRWLTAALFGAQDETSKPDSHREAGRAPSGTFRNAAR